MPPALLRPGVFGIAGAALLTASFVIKLRLEERFLMQELGADAYEAIAAAYRCWCRSGRCGADRDQRRRALHSASPIPMMINTPATR